MRRQETGGAQNTGDREQGTVSAAQTTVSQQAAGREQQTTREEGPRCVVIGIAGGSASGKTTFADALVAALNAHDTALRVELTGMDRYFYRDAPGGPRFVSPTTGENLPDNNHPDSADNARLVADLEARLARPDAPDVLIVEGLMALHVAAVRALLDIRVFVELEADTRALRRLLRDMNGGRGSADPRWIANYYHECARVGHSAYVEPSRVHADLIVRGDADFARVAPLVANAARGLRPALPTGNA